MKKILFINLMFSSVMFVNAQLDRHGLLLHGGSGIVGSKLDNSATYSNSNWADFEYRFCTSVGYRFQFKIPSLSSFHFDIDANAGRKDLKVTYHEENIYIGERSHYAYGQHYFASIGCVANYSLVNKLIVGLGIEPTYYVSSLESNKKKDMPIVAKVAYNFRFLEVGITCKYGLANVLKSEPNAWILSSGKLCDIQLSAFIPLGRRKI